MTVEERLERLESFLTALVKRLDAVQNTVEILSEIDKIRHEPQEAEPCEI